MKKSKNGYFHPENVYRNLKSSIQSPGDLFNSGRSKEGFKERELIREGGLFTKSNDQDIHDSCSVLSDLIFCRFNIKFDKPNT